MQSQFCTWQNSVTGQEPPKMYMYCTSTGDGQTPCKVWLASIERRRFSNAAKTQKPLKFAGVPQTTRPIWAATGPMFTILWGHVEEILLLNKFFSDCRYVPSLQRYSPTRLCDGAEGVIYDDSCESKEELAPLQCPWGTFKDHSNFCHVMPFRYQFLVWPDGVMVKALACDSSSTPGCSAVR